MRRRPLLVLVVPMALVLAACGSDSDASSATSPDASSTSTSTTPTADTIAAATGDSTDATAATSSTPATSTTTSTTTTVVADPGECVPGTWELRAQDFFDQIVAIAGGGATMRHLGGRHLAIFNADGTSEGLREGWSFEVAAHEGSLITTVDATDAGPGASRAT
jgi:hypothetical protein